jgi:hypothetical protein
VMMFAGCICSSPECLNVYRVLLQGEHFQAEVAQNNFCSTRVDVSFFIPISVMSLPCDVMHL